MKKVFSILFVCVLVLSLVGFAPTIPTADAAGPDGSTTLYNVYEKGILRAKLTIEDDAGAKTYIIQKKNIKANIWLDPVSAPESEVPDNPAFRLWGAIRDLPAHLQEIREINWTGKSVAWPDADHIYVRHRLLLERVDPRVVPAWFWALKDGSNPMDFVIGPHNKLIAGVDLPSNYVMVLDGYENFTTVKMWSDPQISPALYGYRALGRQWVEMRDGIKLATQVYLPDDGTDGPYPVILTRTPYGIGNDVGSYWHFCARGYAVVMQECRGTIYWDLANQSEGIWEMSVNEPRDGADCLDWIVAQPWCDGNIGMAGGSYPGHTQWMAEMSGNPALKCIIPEVTMGTAFGDMPFVGGSLIEGTFFYCFYMTNLLDKLQHEWDEILHYRPLIDIDVFATGEESFIINTILGHWVHDDYWKQADWYLPEYEIDVPTLYISGYFDDDHPGTRASWELMQRNERENQRLILGAWKHGYNRDRQLNGFSFGIDIIRDDIWLIKQKWYDRFLKGIENGVEEPVVEYYAMGDNEWRTASEWPPEEAQNQKWYFHSSGNANTSMTDGTLSTVQPAADEPVDIYQYDPENPPPNWMSFEQLLSWEDIQSFPFDFTEIEGRDDEVVYMSAPLKKDLTIAGDVFAVLYASCDVLDTDWWVRLSDVNPDGTAMRLCENTLRARFRNLDDPMFHVFGSNFETEELLSGDFEDVVRYEIRMRDVAHTFKKGHCIRIAVTNACDNYCFPNSNTGEDEAYVTYTVIGTMGIHHSDDYASYVVLPVMPK